MIAALLALASSVVWGLADFGGGVATPAAAVAERDASSSQTAGFVALLVAVAVGGRRARPPCLRARADRRCRRRGGARVLLPGALAGDDERRLADRGVQRGRSARGRAGERRAPTPDRTRRKRGRARGRRSRVGGRTRVGLRRSPALARSGGDSDARRSGCSSRFSGERPTAARRCRRSRGHASGSLSLLLAAALVWRAPLRLPRRALGIVALIGLLDVAANALFAAASAQRPALRRLGAGLALPGDDGAPGARAAPRAAEPAPAGRSRRGNRGRCTGEHGLSTKPCRGVRHRHESDTDPPEGHASKSAWCPAVSAARQRES